MAASTFVCARIIEKYLALTLSQSWFLWAGFRERAIYAYTGGDMHINCNPRQGAGGWFMRTNGGAA